MVASYEGISLDHLADHLVYLSSSSSFWFSLNSSYDHEFHLSKRLGMSPQDYEYLLIALDLASIHKRWGFSIKVMKWKVFLERRRRQHGGGAAAASAAVAAAQHRYVGGGGSATARRRRKLGGGTAAAAASAAVAAARSVAGVHSATVVARLQQRGCCGGGGSATSAAAWRWGGGSGSVSGSGGSATLGGGAQRDGGLRGGSSTEAAADSPAPSAANVRAFERHRRADVRVFVLGRGRRDDSADGIVVVGSDGGARGDVHRGHRCAAAASDDADGNADDIC